LSSIAQKVDQIIIPSNPKYLRSNFVSPFSRKQKVDMSWDKISNRWKGFESAKHWLNTYDLEMIQHLSHLQMASNLQLIKFFPDREKAKVRLKKLASAGIVVRHQLTTASQKIPVYTLGPQGAEILNHPFTPNWWANKSPYGVLRQLIANQLYFRMKSVKVEANFLPTPVPFSGIIECHRVEFLVCVTNGQDISQEMKWENNQRLLVIAESLEELELSAKQINAPARFTTDYEMFTIELKNAFYRYDHSSLVPEVIPMFE
jgi:hypothetical protein